MNLSFAVTSLRIGAGFLIWAAHFMTIYVYVALVCARGDPAAQWFGLPTIHVTIALITLVSVAAAATALWKSLRGQWHEDAQRAGQPFVAWISAAVAVYGLLAVLWASMPAVWVAVCAPA